MKRRFHLSLLLFGLLTACERPPAAAPLVTTETPAPARAPHTSAVAQEAAIRLYPDLAVKDSMFNRAFLEVVASAKRESPRVFDQPDWPLKLADRTGEMLGVLPRGKKPTPVATPALVERLVPTPVVRSVFRHYSKYGSYATPSYGEGR